MNAKVDIAEVVSRLIDCTIEGFDLRRITEIYRGTEKRGTSVLKTSAEDYSAAMRELHSEEKTVFNSYALITFEVDVADFIAPFVRSKTKPDVKKVRGFLNGLKGAQFVRYDAFRPIRGLRITEGKVPPVVLGPFTIFDSLRHMQELDLAMYNRFDSMGGNVAPYMVHAHVDARDSGKALELTDEMFERFERILRYMLAHDTDAEVSILNRIDERTREACLFDSAGNGTYSTERNVRKLVDIDSVFFIEPKHGHDKIWRLLSSASNSEMGTRLLLAVEWIGQSFAERVPSSAFLKAAIAVEILFTPEQGFITPSIASQISESVAMVLGTDVASRFALEKEVKDLYKIRSGVAHSGKADVHREHLERMQDIACQLVTKVLTLPSLTSVPTSVELQKVLKIMKYGCPAIT